MKFKNLFLGILACAGLAACSNEDLVENNSAPKEMKGTAYLNVQLTLPSNTISRAATYEDGDPSENLVSNATFYFFNSGKECGVSPVYKEFTIDKNSTENDNVWGENTVAIKVNGIAPNQVVAVLNGTAVDYSSLDALRNSLQSESHNATSKTFLMTNAAYSTTDAVYASTISSNQLYSSVNDAEKARDDKSVLIPVERVVAKVEALNGTGFPGNNITVKNNEGSDLSIDIFDLIDNKITAVKNVSVTANLTGYRVAYDAKDGNLIKNINGVENWDKWNDANNHRSYWGVSRSLLNDAYSFYAASTKVGDNEQYNTTPLYCQENTNSSTNVSTIVVTAKLNLSSTSFATYGTGTGKSLSFYKFNGSYYTEAALKAAIVNSINSKKDYSITSDKIDLTNFSASVKCQVHPKYTGSDHASEVQGILDNLTILGWTNGECYYFKHITTTSPDGKLTVKGIIRNSVYKINITGVTGTGTPIVDPHDPIIPDNPPVSQDTYMSATIQVLAWRVVSQDVNLGK